jgi:hypothetical protein
MIKPDFLTIFHLIFAFQNRNRKRQRRRARLLNRLDWNTLLERDCQFLKRALRMDIESFDKLVGIISDTLKRNMKQGDRRGGAIKPILCVFAIVQFGGLLVDPTGGSG